MNSYQKLSLMIKSENDLHYVSALIQDAIIHKSGINYDNGDLVIFMNRFAWDHFIEDKKLRIHAVMVIKNVANVEYINFDKRDFLNILSIIYDYQGTLCLVFSDNKKVKMNVDNIDIRLSDVDEHWDTDNVPNHGNLSA